MEVENTKTGLIKSLERKLEGGFFDRSDRISIIAALVDSALIGIGIVVTILWISSQHPKPVHTVTSQWIPSSPNAAVLVTPTAVIDRSHLVTMTICTLYVDTHFKDGTSHFVEFRGNCASLRQIASHATTPVRWLAPSTVSYTASGR